MSSARTPRTMSSTLSKAGPSFTSRQAAPMQKRVAPASLASAAFAEHVVDVEQGLALQPGLLGVMGRLRAIFAVLGAGPGLDRKQARKLNLAVRMVAAVHRARLVEQVEQRRLEQVYDFGGFPVVADRGTRLALSLLRLANLTVERIQAFQGFCHGIQAIDCWG